jgi:hypothetical protein
MKNPILIFSLSFTVEDKASLDLSAEREQKIKIGFFIES